MPRSLTFTRRPRRQFARRRRQQRRPSWLRRNHRKDITYRRDVPSGANLHQWWRAEYQQLWQRATMCSEECKTCVPGTQSPSAAQPLGGLVPGGASSASQSPSLEGTPSASRTSMHWCATCHAHVAHTATQVSSFPQVRGGSREAPTQPVRRAKPRHAARGTARFGAPCLERGRPFTAWGMAKRHNRAQPTHAL
jgi:hypothetical protein